MEMHKYRKWKRFHFNDFFSDADCLADIYRTYSAIDIIIFKKIQFLLYVDDDDDDESNSISTFSV